MSKIYLARHGETEWNKEGRSQGCSNDIPLSETGIKQANALADRLSIEKIDLFFSSTLNRAYTTAGIAAERHSKEVSRYKEFLEINFGCWEGLRVADIKERYLDVFEVWNHNPHLAVIPGAENLLQIRERSMSKLFEILKENKEKNILVISHGITIKVMISAIMGIDLANLHKIRQDNTGLNIFEYKNNDFTTILLNDTCHLKHCK